MSDLENPYTASTVVGVIAGDLDALEGECKGTIDQRASCVETVFYTEQRPKNKRHKSIQTFVKLLHATSLGNQFLDKSNRQDRVHFLLRVLKGDLSVDRISPHLAKELGDMAQKTGFPRLVCIVPTHRALKVCRPAEVEAENKTPSSEVVIGSHSYTGRLTKL